MNNSTEVVFVLRSEHKQLILADKAETWRDNKREKLSVMAANMDILVSE